MATGEIFLLYAKRPSKWRIFKYKRWKEAIKMYEKNRYNRPLRY